MLNCVIFAFIVLKNYSRRYAFIVTYLLFFQFKIISVWSFSEGFLDFYNNLITQKEKFLKKLNKNTILTKKIFVIFGI